MEFTPPVTVYIHSLFQLLYHLFLSQTADPPLSKATKVARLQLAYKPGSSSSQRALLQCCWVLRVTHLPFDFPIPITHFPFLISSFLVPGFTSSQHPGQSFFIIDSVAHEQTRSRTPCQTVTWYSTSRLFVSDCDMVFHKKTVLVLTLLAVTIASVAAMLDLQNMLISYPGSLAILKLLSIPSVLNITVSDCMTCTYNVVNKEL